jgi:hypothetical protein
MVITTITKLTWQKKDKENTTFISEWGAYASNIMPFGLCNVPATFQKVVTKTFKEYFEENYASIPR